MRIVRIFSAALALFAVSSGAFAQVGSPIITFQQTVTSSATQFPSNPLYQGLTCFARGTNTGYVYVGNSTVTTSTGVPLSPGQGWSAGVPNSNWIYVVDASGTNYIDCWGN